MMSIFKKIGKEDRSIYELFKLDDLKKSDFDSLSEELEKMGQSLEGYSESELLNIYKHSLAQSMAGNHRAQATKILLQDQVKRKL